MQILVVAGFVVVMSLMPAGGPSARAAPWWVLVACAGAYVAMTYAVTRWNAALGLRRLMRGDAATIRLGRGPVVMVMATHVYLVVALVGLMLAGWGSLVNEALGLTPVPLAGRLLALAPFVAALVVHWWAIYPLEQAVRSYQRREMAFIGEPVVRPWSRREFLSFNIRHHLLFVGVPAVAIVFVVDLAVLLVAAGWIGAPVAGAVGLAGGAGVFLLAPVVLVRIWRARPLRGGALRDRLVALCRQGRLSCRDILAWDTGGMVANAAVMGLAGRLRYVLLSDLLLMHLDADGVEAIFAHEAGHVRHRHIPYMIAFTAGLLLLCAALAEAAAGAAGVSEAQAAVQLPTLVLTALLWGWLFGMISRRFERQADVFAAHVAGGGGPGEALTARGVAVFAEAMLKVARLNGTSPAKRNFRHGSIDRRLGYLQELMAAGRGPATVDAGVRRLKRAIWILFAAGVLVNALPLLGL